MARYSAAMMRLLRISVICVLGWVSCRRGSPAEPSEDREVGPTRSASTASLSAPASAPDVCSVISADEVAHSYQLPITKSEGIKSGARCDYMSAHGVELFISLLIWHGVYMENGVKQDPRVYLADMHRGRGMGRVFGSLHSMPGLGDEALWVAYALVPSPDQEPTAPKHVQVVVRRGDSLVSVIRNLPEAEAKNEAVQEQAANHAKAVLSKLLALLGG